MFLTMKLIQFGVHCGFVLWSLSIKRTSYQAKLWLQYKLIICSSQLNSLSVISPCIWIMWACTAISLDTFLRFATAVCIYCIIMCVLRLVSVVHTQWCRLMTIAFVYIITLLTSNHCLALLYGGVCIILPYEWLGFQCQTKKLKMQSVCR